MLSLMPRNEDKMLQEAKTIIERSSIPPGISSIELPPFSDVSLININLKDISKIFQSLKHF